MRRVAAHYIWYKDEVCRLHYIELDDAGCFCGVYPLREEIAGTAFYDGVLFLASVLDPVPTFREALLRGKDLSNRVKQGMPVVIYHLTGIPLTSAKFGTDYSGGDGYIERL